MPARKVDLAIRFWSKVDKNGSIQPHMTTHCWVWVAAKFGRSGYGAIQVDARARRAHRVVWSLVVGPVDDSIDVLHRCDNPSCVRPDHLFLGTDIDNIRDRDQKGRQATGNKHGSRLYPERRPRGKNHWTRQHPDRVLLGSACGASKLTEADVRNIRSEYVPYRVSQTKLAKKYGVDKQTIGRVVRGEYWGHVT